MSLQEALDASDVICSGRGSLFLLDLLVNDYKLVTADASMILTGNDKTFEYLLSVYNGEQAAWRDTLGPHLNASFTSNAINWLAVSPSRVAAFKFVFTDNEEWAEFYTLVPTKTQKAGATEKKNLGKADSEWVAGAYDREEIEENDEKWGDPDANFDSQLTKTAQESLFVRPAPRKPAPPVTPQAQVRTRAPVTPYATPGNWSDEESTSEESDDERYSPERKHGSSGGARATRTGPRTLRSPMKGSANKRDQNCGLEIGSACQRTFVMRESEEGTKIGVFDDELQLVAQINGLNLNGLTISADQVQLHERDNKMLILDSERSNSSVYV